MLSLITAYGTGTLGTVFSVLPNQQIVSIRDVPRGGIQFTAKSGWSAPCRTVWASQTLLHGLVGWPWIISLSVSDRLLKSQKRWP